MSSSSPTPFLESGFTDQLVSVIPPTADLHPTSNIKPASRGKVPGRRSVGGWCGYDWRRHQPTPLDVKGWIEDGANLGLRADRFPAIDIDVLDEEMSKLLIAAVRKVLGPAPCRSGRPPKALLMYRLTDDALPFGRQIMRIRRGETTHLIEVLGQGQQYVVYGTHPAGMQYLWDSALPSLVPESLTSITQDDVERLFAELEILARENGFEVERSGTGRAGQDHPPQDQLKAPSLEALREAVEFIPNGADFDDRDAYITMGYAIKAAAQEFPNDGEIIFLDWAGRWANGVNEPEVVQSDWAGMNAPYRVGWRWIADRARPYGFNDAAFEFANLSGDIASSVGPVLPPLFSDRDLANQVIANNHDYLRYVASRKQWLVYDGTRWAKDMTGAAVHRIGETLIHAAHARARIGATTKAKSQAEAEAKRICSRSTRDNVAGMACTDPRLTVTPEQLDADDWVLNTPGGVVDLRAGKLIPGGPERLVTKCTAVAPDFTADCAQWKTFLDEATAGDASLVRYLQRLAGYCLTGVTSEHVIVFVHGPGGNGKSVFLSTLSHVLGDYAMQAPMSTFLTSANERHPTEVAALDGARLVAASETGEGGRWHEARLKSLSGGDSITSRYLYCDFFTFTPKCKLLLVGNHKPQLRTVDEAIRRRLHLVPFNARPSRPDPDLFEKLKKEAPAILAWMIQGCIDWQLLELAPSRAVVRATGQYFEDQDALGRWLTEECESNPNAGAFEETGNLFSFWEVWCRANAEDPGSSRTFTDGLVRLGYRRSRHPRSRRSGFRGIVLTKREQWPATDDFRGLEGDHGVLPDAGEERSTAETSPLAVGHV